MELFKNTKFYKLLCIYFLPKLYKSPRKVFICCVWSDPGIFWFIVDNLLSHGFIGSLVDLGFSFKIFIWTLLGWQRAAKIKTAHQPTNVKSWYRKHIWSQILISPSLKRDVWFFIYVIRFGTWSMKTTFGHVMYWRCQETFPYEKSRFH